LQKSESVWPQEVGLNKYHMPDIYIDNVWHIIFNIKKVKLACEKPRSYEPGFFSSY